MNIPNALTVGRIAVVPVIVAVYYAPKSVMDSGTAHGIATALFIAAALTDWLDGWLARKLGQQTEFGAFADPLADKILVAVTLIMMVHAARLHAVLAMIIIGREIAISGLREWMAQKGKRDAVKVGQTGKLKTAAQLIGLPLLMCDVMLTGSVSSMQAGVAVMWLASGLAIWSMCEYAMAAWRELRQGAAVKKGAPAMVSMSGKAA